MTARSSKTYSTINIVLDRIKLDSDVISYKVNQTKHFDHVKEGILRLPNPVKDSFSVCCKCNSKIEVNIFVPNPVKVCFESDEELFDFGLKPSHSPDTAAKELERTEIKIEPLVVLKNLSNDEESKSSLVKPFNKSGRNRKKTDRVSKPAVPTEEVESERNPKTKKRREKGHKFNGKVEIEESEIIRTVSEKVFKTLEDFDQIKAEKMKSVNKFPYYEIMTMGDNSSLYFLKNGKRTVFIMTNFDLRSLTCNICHMAFTEPIYLLLHRRNHFFQAGILKCFACEEENFKSEQEIHRHTNICSKYANLQKNVCKHCGKQFESLNVWRRHEQTHFEQDGLRSKKICEICSMECSNGDALRIHKRRLHKIDPLQCDHCAKTFAFRNLLRDHLVVKHFPWVSSAF